MKDYRTILTSQIYELLSGITSTYSIIPNGISGDYIYIGDISATQEVCKSGFRYTGIMNITLYTDFNIKSSLITHFGYVDDIKNALKPTKSFVLDVGDDWSMGNWILQGDNSLEGYNEEKRVYTTNIQFSFDISETTEVVEDLIYIYGGNEGGVPHNKGIVFNNNSIREITEIKIDYTNVFGKDTEDQLSVLIRNDVLTISRYDNYSNDVYDLKSTIEGITIGEDYIIIGISSSSSSFENLSDIWLIDFSVKIEINK